MIFFSNKAVRTNFKDQLKSVQQKARDEAKAQGKVDSRIARKYQGDYSETMLQVEDDDGEDEDDEDEEVEE